MALFGSKKNTTKSGDAPLKVAKTTKPAKIETAEVVVATREATGMNDLSHIIVRPRITEKASMKAESNVYAFEVSTVANKKSIAAAIKEMFNVTPVKIAIVPSPKKQVFVRNRKGITGGGKKAYIYLKKGETIEFA